MFNLIKKICTLFGKRRLPVLFFLFLLNLFTSLFEAYVISLLVPLSEMFFNNAIPYSFKTIQLICHFLIFKSEVHLKFFILISYIILYIIKGLARIFVTACQLKFIFNTKAEFQNTLVANAIYKPYSYYTTSSSSDMLRICTDDIDKTFSLVANFNSFITEAVTFFVLVINGIIINPLISLSFGVLLTFEMLLISKVFKNYIKKCSIQIQKNMSSLLKCITQFFHGIKDVKINMKEKYFIDEFSKSSSASAFYHKRQTILTSSIPILFEIGTVTSVGVICLFAIHLSVDFISQIPSLFAMAALGIKILQSANRLSGSYAGIFTNIASLDIVIESMNNIEINNKDSAIEVLPLSFNDSCELKNITYKYPFGKNNVIENSNLNIPSGKSIGIIGESGGGKTTTIDILLGLYEPDKGNVLVDGIDIKNKKKEWLKNISYVPQNIYMLDDTIKANVAFGIDKKNIDEERVLSVLKEACLEKYIYDLKFGINERVGENGIKLSGGQKQRIGIARALYKDPKLIIFDEATSALDNDTEKEIMETINKLHGSRTIIIVAHRLTTIEKCDIVYKIQNHTIERIK